MLVVRVIVITIIFIIILIIIIVRELSFIQLVCYGVVCNGERIGKAKLCHKGQME